LHVLDHLVEDAAIDDVDRALFEEADVGLREPHLVDELGLRNRAATTDAEEALEHRPLLTLEGARREHPQPIEGAWYAAAARRFAEALEPLHDLSDRLGPHTLELAEILARRVGDAADGREA